MNICIFGDSITWGPRLPFRVAWANLMRNHFEKNSEELYSIYDLGIDGNTTRNLIERIDTEAAARKPGLIIFNIGVNDSLFRESEDFPEVPLDEFVQNMQILINKAKTFTKTIVIVGLVKGSDDLTTPLIQSTTGKSYTKSRAKLYNDKLREIANNNNLIFIDVFNKLTDLDFDDGLHPNINGHIKIFESVRFELDKILKLKPDKYLYLVDELDNPIGIKKVDFVESKDITRVSLLWLHNDRGQVLLSKRPVSKRRDPNRWGPAVATHVDSHQTYLSAIKFASKNEIGLNVGPLEKKDKVKVSGEYNFYCQLYALKTSLDIESLKLNPTETQEVKWFNKSDLIKQYNEKPHLFVQSFDKYLEVFVG